MLTLRVQGREIGFNPTLVRLKQFGSMLVCEMRPSFNPTLVRLKQTKACSSQGQHSKFQSHFGSIKTPTITLTKRLYRCFNPTLVRLKQVRKMLGEQFTKGFNPTLVRLKPRRTFRQVTLFYVSIPLWFD